EVGSRGEGAGGSLDVAEARIGSADADLAAARANAAVARAQVDVAASEVRRTETLLQYTQIRAPFDGIITRRLVNPDDLVQAAAGARSAPLFTCQQIDTVRGYCDVPETNVPAIGP